MPDNLPTDKVELAGMNVEGLALPEVGANFDMTLYVSNQRESVSFDLVYNADLFDEPRIEELLAQLEHLLAQVVVKPHAPISQLSLLTPTAERVLPNPAQILDEQWPGAVHTLFSDHARRSPEASRWPTSMKAGLTVS